jgi:RNA polymerase sigma-70 factor, ECF subfamily
MNTFQTALNEEFVQSAEPFRRELLAHCYRMLGSATEAEDLVQETLLRAWRAYGSFDPAKGGLRTWLYKIATNACLSWLGSRQARTLPSDLSQPSHEPPLGPAHTEIPWLQPLPDVWLTSPSDPANLAVKRDSVRLAFVAALQHLPAKQRAVLLLREVLAWRAGEVAELLDTSTAAVNSALQRARAQLGQVAPTEDDLADPRDPKLRALLESYVRAFEDADISALVGLLREDVVTEMPPSLTWYLGRDATTRFAASVFARQGAGTRRMIETSANGQPALAMYRLGDDGLLHGLHVQVLGISSDGISRITAFEYPGLFATFRLPESRPPSGAA